MAYLDSLDEDHIFRLKKRLVKETAIKVMAEKAAKNLSGFYAADIYKKLLEREESTSTGMGNALAIPHTRLKGITEPIIMLFISSDGVHFNSIDGKPVKVFFLVLSPEERTESHLLVLQEIAIKAADIGFADSLAEQTNLSGILHFLRT